MDDFTLLYTQAQMDAMIAAMIAAAKEGCAKIADRWDFGCDDGGDHRAQGIAEEIRSGK